MPRRRSSSLQILLNGRRLGQLNRASNWAIDFQYDRDWLAWEHAIPVSLSIPLSDRRYTGGPVTAVFENLLPDNDQVRRRVAEKLGAEGTDAYSLLSLIGRDCVGALQFVAEGEDPAQIGTIEAEPVSNDDIAHILANLANAPLGLKSDDAFRISIAGAQEKTALLWWNERWNKPIGATPTTHIFKPQIGRLPNGIDLSHSVENEHFCLSLMRELGLPTALTEMAIFGDRPVLIVTRFDRQSARDGRILRRPQEDMCQALSIPPTMKYEDHGGPGIQPIMELLAGSDAPDEDRAHFMRSMIIFWLIGATDGHAKNFSIFLTPGARFRFTPAYDVLSADPSLAAGQINQRQMRLAMAIGDRRRYRVSDICPRHFIQTAVRASYSEEAMRGIFQDLRQRGPAALEAAIAAMPDAVHSAVVDPIAQAFTKRLMQIDLL